MSATRNPQRLRLRAVSPQMAMALRRLGAYSSPSELVSESELGDLFSDAAKAVSGAAKAVAKDANDAVNAVKSVVSDPVAAAKQATQAVQSAVDSAGHDLNQDVRDAGRDAQDAVNQAGKIASDAGAAVTAIVTG